MIPRSPANAAATPVSSSPERLESWKEIAAYLKRSVSTVQRWEQEEGLPVHRLVHAKAGSVYAIPSELDAWYRARDPWLDEDHPGTAAAGRHPGNGDGEAGSRSAGAPGEVGASDMPAASVVLPAPVDSRGRRTRWRRAAGMTTASLALVALVGASVLYLRRGPIGSREGTAGAPMLTRVTFGPGLQTDPTLSPDGRFIAYTADRAGNFDIWMQPVSGGDPVQVTHDPAHDWQPAWSPDGSRIAFRSERQGGGLYVVAPTGGDERRITDFGALPQWSPDSMRILFASSSLPYFPNYYIVALDGGLPRPVKDSPVAQAPRGIVTTWHPDGRRLVSVIRRERLLLFALDPETGDLQTATVAPAVNREFERVELNPTGAVRWPAGTRTVYFAGGSKVVTNVWRIEVDPDTFTVTGGPFPVTVGTGLEGMTVSGDGRRIAYSVQQGHPGISLYRLDPSGERLADTAPQPLTSPEEVVLYAELDRSGSTVAMIVHRPGDLANTCELRIADIATRRQQTLLHFDNRHGRDIFAPRWSPDGSLIAYRYTAASGENRRHSIHVVDRSGRDRQVTSPTSRFDNAMGWSADGRFILAASNRYDPPRISSAIVPLGAAPSAERAARVIASDVDAAQWNQTMSPDGRWIAFNSVSMSDRRVSRLNVMSPQGGAWHRVTDGTSWDDLPHWSPDGRFLYFLSHRGGMLNIWGVRFDGGRAAPAGAPFQLTRFRGPGEWIPAALEQVGFGVGTGWLAVPVRHTSGSIWLVEQPDRVGSK